jgi:hypothetical protein
VTADPVLDRPRPRNRRAFDAARELHAEIEAILRTLLCPHCHRAPAAKEVLARLPDHLKRDPRTVRTHIREVMDEIGERCGNLSAD